MVLLCQYPTIVTMGVLFHMKYNRIKDLREDSDLTQKQVSEMLHMHKTTYTRYETGERELPFNIAILIAQFYNVSLDYLAGLTNNKHIK